jgi:hypothetical protein
MEPPEEKLRKPRMTPAKRLSSVMAFRVKKAWKEFHEKLAGREPDAEEIHSFCCAIKATNIIDLEWCKKCSRALTTRQQYRPCPFCGYNRNYIHAEARRKIRRAAKDGIASHAQRLAEKEKMLDEHNSKPHRSDDGSGEGDEHY